MVCDGFCGFGVGYVSLKMQVIPGKLKDDGNPGSEEGNFFKWENVVGPTCQRE